MKSLFTVFSSFAIVVAIPASQASKAANDKDISNIHAKLSQTNSSFCTVTLNNSAPNDIEFLTWNSLFDPNTEFHSFLISDITTHERLSAGTGMVRKIYAPEVLPEHILRVPAHSTWTGTYDLTKIFDVPSSGQYNVSLVNTLKAVSNMSLHKSHVVHVSSDSIITNLTKSEHNLKSKGKRDQINDCDAGQNFILRQALDGAKTMALQAYQNTPTSAPQPGSQPWYAKYFNDASWTTVRKAFDGVSFYTIDAPLLGLTWACGGNSGGCKPGVFGFAPPPSVSPGGVTLCNQFFQTTWASTACGIPGTTTPSVGTVAQWQTPWDQPMVVLHELLHDALVTGVPNINDGPGYPANQGLYEFDEVIDLAQNAATNGDAPLQNSQNFVYYAMEIRNIFNPTAQCAGCPMTPPNYVCNSVPNSPACSHC